MKSASDADKTDAAKQDAKILADKNLSAKEKEISTMETNLARMKSEKEAKQAEEKAAADAKEKAAQAA